MSVHTPGPRLFSSIPFKHLAGGGHGGGRKSSNVSLNVVPFIDMMTVLTCFLLMTFSATGEIIMAQKGVTLPDATNKDQLRKAPVIVISPDAITFNGEGMGDPRALDTDTSMEWKVVELYERLRAEKTAFEMNFDQMSDIEKKKCRCAPGTYYKASDDRCEQGEPPPAAMCLRGLLILQADKGTTAKVINRVLKTSYAADYRNIMFAINQRSRKR
jgi:biopolymer transport protein ExbD